MTDRNALANQVGTDRRALATAEADRVAAVRRRLLGLGLDGEEPRWSSAVLDRLVADVVQAPDGSVGDLLHALFGVLGDYTTELSAPAANLIKDLVVRCFTGYPQSYSSVDWGPIIDRLVAGATSAQFYLALQAIPPEFVRAPLAAAIAQGLSGTPFQAEAESTLAG
ncbi:MAG: hypothetical protein U0797_21800 [Gemmataceae bacterium]